MTAHGGSATALVAANLHAEAAPAKTQAAPAKTDAAPVGTKAALAGKAGYCTSANGVTVVVDFTDLDQAGDGRPDYGIVVRCVNQQVQNGVQALQVAGFSPVGTAQYGLAFVCRIAGRPAADEPLNRSDDPGYTEQCQQTPPQTAFWEYWTAPNGGPWTFSGSGAGGHHPIAGGFEGWSFSLNASHHPPGVAPVRPAPTVTPPSSASLPPPATTAATSKPSPSRPAPPARPGSGVASHATSPGASHATSPGASHATSPGAQRERATKPAPPATPPSPSLTVAPSTPHRAAASSGVSLRHRNGRRQRGPQHHQRPTTPVVTTEEQSTSPRSVSSDLPNRNAAVGSSDPAGVPLAGFGLLALLAGGAGITAWRRSRRV